MDKESTELILQHLNKLEDKLGVAADKIWPWFIKEVYIEAILSTIILVLISAISFFYFKDVLKHWNSIARNGNEHPWVVGGVTIGISLIVLLLAFLCTAPQIFNPEYHAFTNLIAKFK